MYFNSSNFKIWSFFKAAFIVLSHIAQDKIKLKELGITHVLNASKGEKYSQVNTNKFFYEPLGINFYGCNLVDVRTCNIERHFDDATEFIKNALDAPTG